MNNLPVRLCGTTQTDVAEYLRQIRTIPLLKPSEERELARRFHEEGCEISRDRLICANLRLVVFVAKRYAGLGVPLADLVEAGNVGLIRAVGKFDLGRGARFTTYAVWWIRQSVLKAVAAEGSLIRVPDGHRRVVRTCADVAAKLAASLGRPATTGEVARETGLTPRATRSAMESVRGVAAAGGDDALDHMGSVADPRTQSPDEVAGHRERRERLRASLHSLQGAEAQVIRLHFGLDGRAPLTVRDIGRELGMSAAAVERALMAGLGRLELLLGARSDESVRAAARVAAG